MAFREIHNSYEIRYCVRLTEEWGLGKEGHTVVGYVYENWTRNEDWKGASDIHIIMGYKIPWIYTEMYTTWYENRTGSTKVEKGEQRCENWY